jgi:PTS system nitrogen regulatory IIA component
MRLVDYLCREAVCMDLQAAERDTAIRELLDQLVASGAMPEALLRNALLAVLKRERLGSTAIGRGVAVPHARVDGLGRVVVAFGRSSAGVEFSALDGGPVHHVFLVVAGRDCASEYLALMQRVSRLVQNDDFRRFVKQARQAGDLVDLIAEMDT